MTRILAILVAAGVAAVPASSVSAEEAQTTRIEPNSSYGATVTVEEGVRVFRPLPSERQVIVNPGQTPLGLNYYQFQQNGLPVVVPHR
ncbi:MAG: hypothetical protein WC807_21155 [Hyphomicrobium sp.]|jgi:hypothetical protein